MTAYVQDMTIKTYRVLPYIKWGSSCQFQQIRHRQCPERLFPHVRHSNAEFVLNVRKNRVIISLCMVNKDIRVPPQDIEMERALLGALLLNQNAMYEVADLIGVDSFYAGKHRTVFDAMLSLYAKSEPIDVVTVSSKLKERKLLNEVGGASYLSELVGAAASPGSARHYPQGVPAKIVVRSLIDAAAKIGELGFEEDRDIELILDEAQSAVFSVTQTPMLRSFTAIKDELAEAWERLESLQKHSGSMRGIPTGFPQLDNLLAG